MNQLLSNINKRQWLVRAPQTTMVIFIMLNIIAMVFYKGGTIHNTESFGYSFFNNFLSDLGRVVSHSGSFNFHSSLCFNMAMLIAGFILSIFFSITPTLFDKQSNLLTILSILASIFGVLGSLCMIGVGLTPADLLFTPHVMFAHWLFRFFFLSSFFIAGCIYISKDFHNKYALGYVVFSLIIFSYVLFNEMGPTPNESTWALYMQVLLQKAILICFFIAVIIQTKGIELLIDKDD